MLTLYLKDLANVLSLEGSPWLRPTVPQASGAQFGLVFKRRGVISVTPLGQPGGWGVLNQENVWFRSCVRTRGLVA